MAHIYNLVNQDRFITTITNTHSILQQKLFSDSCSLDLPEYQSSDLASWLSHEIESSQISESALVIVQKYEPFQVSQRSHGLGDFLLGSIRVAEEALRLKRIPWFDFSSHPMNNYFHQLFPATDERPVYLLGKGDLRNLDQYQTIFSHQRPLKNEFTSKAISMVRHQIINPRNILEDSFNMTKQLLDIDDDYSVIHIRTKDSDNLSSDRELRKVIEKIEFSFGSNSNELETSLILTNNQRLNILLRKEGMKVVDFKLYKHFASDSNPDDYIFTARDFLLCLRAKSLTQFSEYSWGSGFSESAHLLSDNKMICYQI